MSSKVTLENRDGIALLTLDDGKANALGYEMLSEANEAFSQAQGESKSVVIAGRHGCLSAGLDLKEVMAGEEQRDAMIAAAGVLFGSIYASPKPVVIAATGHAIAGGAVFLVVGDWNVGAAGAFKVGFSEVAIGVPLPDFATLGAQRRLMPPAFQPAILGDMYTPESALAIGFYDAVVEPDEVVHTALERAEELGKRDATAYARTKLFARQDLIARAQTV